MPRKPNINHLAVAALVAQNKRAAAIAQLTGDAAVGSAASALSLAGDAIPKSIITTPGDLIVGASTGNPVRLAGGPLNAPLRGQGAGVIPAFVPRRTPLDAHTYLSWTLDELVLPLVNGGYAGANGNLDTPNLNSASFGRMGFHNRAMWCNGSVASQGVNGSLSAGLNLPFPFTISAWILCRIQGIDAVFKAYRPLGSWVNPFVSAGVGISNTGLVFGSVTTGGVLHQIVSSPNEFFALNIWHHIGITYDGGQLITMGDGGIVGLPAALAGAVDYSLGGRWAVGVPQDNAAVWSGLIDDVRIDDVARNEAWFANIWRTGMGID